MDTATTTRETKTDTKIVEVTGETLEDVLDPFAQTKGTTLAATQLQTGDTLHPLQEEDSANSTPPTSMEDPDSAASASQYTTSKTGAQRWKTKLYS